MQWLAKSLAGIFVSVSLCTGASAQDIGVQLSQVLVVDSERVLRASQAGQKITADLEARLQALVAENRRIEAVLVAEELDLTQKRPTMDPVTFRALADAFNIRVQEIRATQDAKQQELQQLRDAENQSFMSSITPVLAAIARERGALVIVERRSVLLSADSIDITEQAIALINAQIEAQIEVQSPQDVTNDAQTNE
jgi:Skp family chaperone for outer membrane proteins